jgi:hypothetical protein
MSNVNNLQRHDSTLMLREGTCTFLVSLYRDEKSHWPSPSIAMACDRYGLKEQAFVFLESTLHVM